MQRNVEVKVKLSDHAKTLRLILSNSNKIIKIGSLYQVDTFYNTATGRLKIREIDGFHYEVIWYDRVDISGPKLSNYTRINLTDANIASFKDIFSKTLGVSGQVNKTRTLFMYGQTRIHFDEVDTIGFFLELEVVLEDTQSVEYGENIANEIMKMLDLHNESKIEGSYMDIINKSNQKRIDYF